MWDKYENLLEFEPIRQIRAKGDLRVYNNLKKAPPEHTINTGDIHNISNKVWKIPIDKGYTHPGAVLGQGGSYHRVTVSKGTDVKNIRNSKLCYFVGPSDENKLKKPTGFDVAPKEIRMVALQTDNFRGCLSDTDLENLINLCSFD